MIVIHVALALLLLGGLVALVHARRSSGLSCLEFALRCIRSLAVDVTLYIFVGIPLMLLMLYGLAYWTTSYLDAPR